MKEERILRRNICTYVVGFWTSATKAKQLSDGQHLLDPQGHLLLVWSLSILSGGSSAPPIGRECENQGAPNCYRQPWHGSWHKTMNIFLPGQVATAEILLERNQNPNRSGKSLASKALGNRFSLCLFWALLFPVAGPFLDECSLTHQMTCSLKRAPWEQSREASESNNLVISQLFPILLTPLS